MHTYHPLRHQHLPDGHSVTPTVNRTVSLHLQENRLQTLLAWQISTDVLQWPRPMRQGPTQGMLLCHTRPSRTSMIDSTLPLQGPPDFMILWTG
jgi:hypothetical protein